MDFKNISVIITCRDESANIARCLESVSGFGETVLVDSFSCDNTLDIARGYPVTIFVRPYDSAAAQKNWALSMVKNRWVLILDADEELTEPLRAEIRRLETKSTEGYWIRRTSEYLGRTIRGCGWQRDKVMRLFDREAGRYEQIEVHEEVRLAGKTKILNDHRRKYLKDK